MNNMRWVSHIDWFTATLRCTIEDYRAEAHDMGAAFVAANNFFLNYGMGEEGVEPCPATRFYRYAFRDVDSGVVLHIPLEPENQGVMLVGNGSACRRLENVNETCAKLLMDGWNFSRLDMALDVFDGGQSVKEVAFCYNVQSEGNKQRRKALIESRTGDTFYIGSRTSAKFYRVYDKGAEQRVDYDWIRVEAEYKQEAAVNVMHETVLNPTAWVADVLRVLGDGWHGGVFDALRDARTVDVFIPTTVPRTESGSERWIRQTVGSVLARLMREDYDLLREVMTTAMRETQIERLDFRADNSVPSFDL